MAIRPAENADFSYAEHGKVKNQSVGFVSLLMAFFSSRISFSVPLILPR
jgi:hypothetical protein